MENLIDSGYKYKLENGEILPIYKIKKLSITDCAGYVAFKPNGTKMLWYRDDEIGYAQLLASSLSDI